MQVVPFSIGRSCCEAWPPGCPEVSFSAATTHAALELNTQICLISPIMGETFFAATQRNTDSGRLSAGFSEPGGTRRITRSSRQHGVSECHAAPPALNMAKLELTWLRVRSDRRFAAARYLRVVERSEWPSHRRRVETGMPASL